MAKLSQKHLMDLVAQFSRHASIITVIAYIQYETITVGGSSLFVSFQVFKKKSLSQK
jgi:hypothetical protein